MSVIVTKAKDQIEKIINDAVLKAVEKGELEAAELNPFKIDVPQNREHGDYAVNAAMVWSKAFRNNPRKIAEILSSNFDFSNTYIDRFEIAGPGFLNFFLSDKYYADIIADVKAKGEEYGKSNYGEGKKVLVEFVSANPTGPMHIGNARGGALGDCLASVMSAAGYKTEREFYINDAGNQIEKFATSLELRYLQMYKDGIEMPEDSYHGEDIINHAKAFAEINGDSFVNVEDSKRRKALVDFALPKNIQSLKDDLLKYRIEYNTWFKESSLHQNGETARIIELLKKSGHTYTQDDAVWFKATDFGCDKDFVLVRANGIPTYVVPDIAYHYNKLVTRGFDKAIDVLGADHHGYVPRLKAALTALGVDADKLDVLLMQMVRLIRNGEVIKASKRSGKAITLVTLLDEVPIDAARFFFNLREPNSHFDFDLDLAVEQTNQNPVYYVQYAHARICSIIRNLSAEGVQMRDCTADELCKLTAPEERELILHIAEFTNEIIMSAKTYDPAKMTHYVVELATKFHKFYNACRVKGEEESLMQARLNLCDATATVIRNVLSMLKISAPESM
ncbi:MAG: arginine--tRNA ligase [Clostridia bacterium]|nr:arginine--tRNA ligase [Clostridia bacterium]MBQ9977740.1 arginine--tRNA ligase [Clostridia bacterium]